MELTKNTIIGLLDTVRTESIEYYNEIVSEINGFKTEGATDLLNFMSEYLYSDERHYFTISSKDTFNDFENTVEGYTFVYSPLNDHSRPFMHKGDIVFCYRQGQFGNLEEALNVRGIYAVGVCMADPKEIYQEENGHNRWGVAITIPIVINKHLELRNIQLNPTTINLTPYNGNRNDSLQYIEKSEHYYTLLELVCARNKNKKEQIEILLKKYIRNIVLPDDVWNNSVKKIQLPKLESNMPLPYLTAIRTKPFLLLAGISGTGKSRIVRKLAQATNDIDFAADYDGEDRWKMHNPTNFCLIQVKPNWHNSMDVVGFKSNIGGAHYEFTPFVEFIAKAWQHLDTPFFLCLDEMNLAPVEEYFAEFLSAIESRSFNKDGEYETDPIIKPFDSFGPEVCGQMIGHLVDLDADADCKLENQFRTKGLTLPKNLIVMGTVNMDETTFSFSRKVLDRAMSIEMNEVNYDAFLTGETEEDVPLLTDCNMLLVERPINAQTEKANIEADKIIEYLKQVNALLEGTPFKLGYRAANEAFLYLSASKMFGSDDLGSALDNFTVMKILSRIEGDDSKLKTKTGEDLLPALLELLTNQFGKDGKSVSVQKLSEMNDILNRDHFVSFWG